MTDPQELTREALIFLIRAGAVVECRAKEDLNADWGISGVNRDIEHGSDFYFNSQFNYRLRP